MRLHPNCEPQKKSSPLYFIVGLLKDLKFNIPFIVGLLKDLKFNIPFIVGIKNGVQRNISLIMCIRKGLPNMSYEISYNQICIFYCGPQKPTSLVWALDKGERRTISLIVSQISKNTPQCYMSIW